MKLTLLPNGSKVDFMGTVIRPNCPSCHGTGDVESWTCVACQVAHVDAQHDADDDFDGEGDDPYGD